MGGAETAIPAGLREALAAYPQLASDWESLTATTIGSGLLHASFAVETRDASFVAQRVSPVFSPRIHQNIVDVTRHLRARGCPTITLCPTRDGAPFVELADGERWRVMERIDGAAFEHCTRAEQARSAGAAVARFHSALADFEAPLDGLGFPFHDIARSYAELRSALADHADHPRAGDVSRLAEQVLAAAERDPPPPDVPDRVVHGDLKISNVLFEDTEPPGCDRVVALIDLDTVCRLPLWIELGDAWRSWSNRRAEDVAEAELDSALFGAAVEGYRSGLAFELEPAERRSLETGLERVALELCARFATDALREQYFGWDAARFASASDHNWARACGQWSLFTQARDTQTERLRALRD